MIMLIIMIMLFHGLHIHAAFRTLIALHALFFGMHWADIGEVCGIHLLRTHTHFMVVFYGVTHHLLVVSLLGLLLFTAARKNQQCGNE